MPRSLSHSHKGSRPCGPSVNSSIRSSVVSSSQRQLTGGPVLLAPADHGLRPAGDLGDHPQPGYPLVKPLALGAAHGVRPRGVGIGLDSPDRVARRRTCGPSSTASARRHLAAVVAAPSSRDEGHLERQQRPALGPAQPEETSSRANATLRSSSRPTQPGSGTPSRPWPRSPTSIHAARSVASASARWTRRASLARAAAPSACPRSWRDLLHRNRVPRHVAARAPTVRLVKAASSRSHFAPPIRSGFSGRTAASARSPPGPLYRVSPACPGPQERQQQRDVRGVVPPRLRRHRRTARCA